MNSLEWESAIGHVQNMEVEVVETHGKRKNLLWIIPLACFVLLIFSPFLLAPVYNRWAVQAFERHIAELEAMGETLDIEKLKPEPFEHPEKTFAHHPLIVRLIDEAENGDSEDPDLLLNRLSVNAIPGQTKARGLKKPRYFGGKALPEFDPPLTEDESAMAVLAYCEAHEAEISGFSEATKLTGGHFELEYEKGMTLGFPQAKPVMNLSNLIALRGKARLVMGDGLASFEDVQTLLRSAQKLDGEPTLVMQLIALSSHDSAIGLVQEGLTHEAWNLGQLENFNAALSRCDTDAALLRALRMERAVFVDLMLGLGRNPRKYAGSGIPPGTERFLQWNPVYRGWCSENARIYSELFQEQLLSDASGKPRLDALPTDSEFDQALSDLNANQLRKIRTLFVTLAAPAMSTIVERFHRSRVYRDHARIALALERHRLDTGYFPSFLDPLIAASPDLPVTDPFSGNRYIYETGPVDTYQLYSVGSNRTDEGGMWKKDLEKGDWVWSLTLPTDFNWDDYVN